MLHAFARDRVVVVVVVVSLLLLLLLSPETILMVPSSSLGVWRLLRSLPMPPLMPVVSPPMPHAMSKPLGEYRADRIQPASSTKHQVSAERALFFSERPFPPQVPTSVLPVFLYLLHILLTSKQVYFCENVQSSRS